MSSNKKYVSCEFILLISTVEPMAAMEMRKILQDQFLKQKIYVHFHSGVEPRRQDSNGGQTRWRLETSVGKQNKL